MKILLVNYEYKGQGGGAGQQIYYLAQALRDFGHDVSLLIGWDHKLGEPDLLERVTTYIVKHKRKNIQLSTPLGMLFFVIRGIFRINQITRKQRYDIIQFYFSVPTGILRFGIHGAIPYIISLRGMDIPGLHKDRNKVLSVLTSALNKRITSKATTVISNSNESAAVYKRFAPNVTIDVIHNATDPDIENKDSYSDKITKFIYVGRLISLKRVDLLIDAITVLHSNYTSISLDIYGEGHQLKTLQQHIKDNRAESFIDLKGFMVKEQLLKTMQNYDVFAFASVGDSCPNVLLEAMACGLPVIAARAGGSREIVEEGITGLLTDPDDVEDMIRKLEYCINNPKKMQEFGINCRKRVQDRFSLNSVTRHHVELFNKHITNTNIVQVKKLF